MNENRAPSLRSIYEATPDVFRTAFSASGDLVFLLLGLLADTAECPTVCTRRSAS